LERGKLIPSNGTTHCIVGPAQQLWLTLRWLRHYPAARYLGNDFGISESTIHRNNKRMLLLLKNLFDDHKVIRFPTAEERHWKYNLMYGGKEIAFIIDGNQQPIQRPSKSKEKRKASWSGKEKDYTLVIMIVIGPTGLIYFIPCRSYIGSYILPCLFSASLMSLSFRLSCRYERGHRKGEQRVVGFEDSN
jgi:hypothetical protein